MAPRIVTSRGCRGDVIRLGPRPGPAVVFGARGDAELRTQGGSGRRRDLPLEERAAVLGAHADGNGQPEWERRSENHRQLAIPDTAERSGWHALAVGTLEPHTVRRIPGQPGDDELDPRPPRPRLDERFGRGSGRLARERPAGPTLPPEDRCP